MGPAATGETGVAVELRQLRYFLEVARELHFGRAAEALRVAPSAVSQQVARLERELGTPLLDRSHRAVRLTEAGQRFAPRARAVLDAANAAADSVRVPSRVVRLGTSAGLGTRIAALAERAQLAEPPIRLELSYAPADDRLAAVGAGRLDAAVVRGDSRASAELDFTEVWTDELVIALPSAHPLAAEAAIPLGALAGVPLRIVPRDRNPDLHDTVYAAAAESGFVPTIAGEFGDALHEGFAALAIGPPSWTVFYAGHAQTLAIPGVSFVPATVGPDGRGLFLRAFVVTDARRPLSPVLAEFLDLCRRAGA
ncbi:DNA-binding transcriptional LysR family regulator [Naumannella cuiyingiana]|uniref:DNA-binding transcriptional LysR family regulator n=1 Tax=Naumannella cuiyingiana TaxID=1347891 RepID=A0A7Z0IL35_9ACTN|nr:DNA-binding transcriptional LysR family regulator [Naumannella cuiyingiana]